MITNIENLSAVKIFERGIPNEECIAIQVMESTDLTGYGILIAESTRDGIVLPINDCTFWFGNAIVQKDDWVFIYTGNGKPMKVAGPEGKTETFSLYWGRNETLFADTNIIPVIFSIGSIDALFPPRNQSQKVIG